MQNLVRGVFLQRMGRRIIRLRETQGWNRQTLARVLGVTTQRLGRWERGERQPPLTVLARLKAILGVAVHEPRSSGANDGAGGHERRSSMNNEMKPEPMQGAQVVAPGLKAERVQESLRAMPGWRLLPTGRAIERARQFKEPAHSEAFAVFVARLSLTERQPATIDLTESQVIVTLHAPAHPDCTGGLTQAALDLAAAIG
jgi:transcriptional regulator with XRE-family HTH domain